MSQFHTINLLDTPNTWREAYNADVASIQEEFQHVIHDDGSVAMDGTLNMGGYQIGNVGAASESHQAPNLAQLQAESDKYVATNEIIVHSDFVDVVGKKYQRLETALTYLNGIVYGTDHYCITLKSPTEGSYTIQGAELALYKKNTFLSAPNPTLIQCAIGNNIIDGGASNVGWWSNIIIKFTDTGSNSVKLRNLNLIDSIVIVDDTVDLEFITVQALRCTLIVQSGNFIKLMSSSNNLINFCNLSTSLTENTGVNIENSVNTINDTLASYYTY